MGPPPDGKTFFPPSKTRAGKKPHLGAPLQDYSKEVETLDLSEEAELQSAFAGLMKPGGHVVLHSCSTGSGRAEAESIANLVARLTPEAAVHAPTVPSNNRMVLDADGGFVDPGNWHGKAFSYTVKPEG